MSDYKILHKDIYLPSLVYASKQAVVLGSKWEHTTYGLHIMKV